MAHPSRTTGVRRARDKARSRCKGKGGEILEHVQPAITRQVVVQPPPRDSAVCVDERCPHEACRPAIDFVVESTYAACGFQISELVSLFQRRLSDFVNIALVEDIVPIVHVASTCQLHELLSQCIQRVAGSSVDSRYLEKELPDDAFAKVKEFRRYSLHDDSDEFILDPEHAKKVRNIHKALDCDDVDLVGLLLQESAITLDDALAIHYAAAYCEPKVLALLLKLDPAGDCVNVNLKNDSGYTPLHLACMRREPQILLSLIEKGASVVERTQDGRDALTICKRLTTEKDCNKKLEKCKERSKAYLCIDILEQEIKRKSFIFEELLSAEVSVATPLLVDNFHMRLINLENRVAFARIFFPSEAKLVMRIAQADSTEEFAGLTSANFSKLKEVDLNETPTMQNKRLRERLDALTKTVFLCANRSVVFEQTMARIMDNALTDQIELGRKYFPHCSDVLDKFLMEESTDLHFLESGSAEDQYTRRTRFSELKEDVRKAFSKDKAVAAIASSTSSSSPRGDGKLLQPSATGHPFPSSGWLVLQRKRKKRDNARVVGRPFRSHGTIESTWRPLTEPDSIVASCLAGAVG
ncbi:Regulatory protein NPR3 [Triticum urartu]|uniref:Regulatory protein NPR3 n=1 Tax=Triticum urartu TaxID=4572 RepID=M7YQX4_TRIUA|nr:Regulatory protein NPR3 [Triticum urartu]